MLHKKDLIFPLPPNADAIYYCHVLQERGAYIKQLKAGTLSFKEVYAAYPKLFQRQASNAEVEGLAQIIAATENLTPTEQLKWVKKQPLYEDGQLVTRGTLQINEAMQEMPTNPVDSGNIQQYDGYSQLTLTDTVTDKALQFIAVKIDGRQLLVCDRNIVAAISWNDLNSQNLITGKEVTIDGQKYKLRVLTGGEREGDSCEWDKIMEIVGYYNPFWHWRDMFSWCQETNENIEASILRGCFTATGWERDSLTYRNPFFCWRPVLEVQKVSITKLICKEEYNNPF